MVFRKVNIYVSSAANLVRVERILSEKLRIWLCLFFLLVKMADRGHNKTTIVCINLICIGSHAPENQSRLFLLLESEFFSRNIGVWST